MNLSRIVGGEFILAILDWPKKDLANSHDCCLDKTRGHQLPLKLLDQPAGPGEDFGPSKAHKIEVIKHKNGFWRRDDPSFLRTLFFFLLAKRACPIHMDLNWNWID